MTQLPEKIQGFLKEYKALCDKWGCQVVSDGEEVTVKTGAAQVKRDDYWGIEESTERWLEQYGTLE